MKDYKGALYYLMTEIWEYSPDKGENNLTKQAHEDLLSLIEELEGIKKRAEEVKYQILDMNSYGGKSVRNKIDFIIKGEKK